MRVFSIIFIAYLLLLSWQPCQDLAVKDDFRQSAEAGQSYFLDIQQPERADDCSPFCSCSCCQVSTAYARPIFSVKSRFTVSTAQVVEIFHQNNYFQQHSHSIWQPPKVNFTA